VTAGVCTLLNNALPIGAGVILFREHLPPAGFGVLRVAGFAAVVVGAVLLARGEGESNERTST
jgi:membrane-bound ClpP family serine protease